MLNRLLLLALCCCTLPLHAAVTVQDDTGRSVSLSQPAARIVSLAPHITEQLFAIGAGEKIVGAVEYSDYPEQAKAIPRVGGYSRLDLERILALEPDLVVGWQSGNDARAIERLQALGVTLYLSEPRRLPDIAAGMARLGVLAGVAEQAAQQAGAFRERLDALRRQNSDRKPVTLFYQIWNRPLMTVSGRHLINDVIALCGGRNIFAELDALTPTVSVEAVLAADPEVIIASGMGAERPEWLDEWQRWSQLRAVRNGQLFVIDPNIIQRATPRLLLGAERMCRFLHSP
ncbi:MAG TPA: cobalamin-binding protein [Gammaproteobacteria bacterium]|jgi:iron complex transport system substrate-binding protein